MKKVILMMCLSAACLVSCGGNAEQAEDHTHDHGEHDHSEHDHGDIEHPHEDEHHHNHQQEEFTVEIDSLSNS